MGHADLQAYQNVLNIRIQAPFAYRVKNLMRIEDIRDQKVVEERILENDRVRESFIQTFYEVNCDATGIKISTLNILALWMILKLD